MRGGDVSPRLATALASRLYPYRRAFLIFSLAALAILTAALFLVRTAVASNIVFAAFGPFVLIPWGLLCLCSGFGPGSKISRRFGRVGTVLSWYGSLFLSLWFVLAFAWPFMVLLD